jgi:hypothetical protein
MVSDAKDGFDDDLKAILAKWDKNIIATRSESSHLISVALSSPAESPPVEATSVPTGHSAENVAAPPAISEFFLTALSDAKKADAIIGDLNERFHADCVDPTIGPKRARLRYRASVFRSLRPLFWRWLKRAGLVGLLIDAFRRWTGG